MSGVTNASGASNQYAMGGDSGGGHLADIAGLQKNVGFLNWAVGIVFLSGLGALIALYLILNSSIAENAKDGREGLEHVSDKISDVRVAVAGQSADIKAVLEKLDVRKSQPTRNRTK